MQREARPYKKEHNSRKSSVEIDISCPDEYVRQDNNYPKPEKTAEQNLSVRTAYTE